MKKYKPLLENNKNIAIYKIGIMLGGKTEQEANFIGKTEYNILDTSHNFEDYRKKGGNLKEEDYYIIMDSLGKLDDLYISLVENIIKSIFKNKIKIESIKDKTYSPKIIIFKTSLNKDIIVSTHGKLITNKDIKFILIQEDKNNNYKYNLSDGRPIRNLKIIYSN